MEEINLGKYKGLNKKDKYKKDTAVDWLETQVGIKNCVRGNKRRTFQKEVQNQEYLDVLEVQRDKTENHGFRDAVGQRLNCPQSYQEVRK